jgi:hypothetical protein
MWIRNKGTPDHPIFVLVESRRVAGKKHPQQVTVCRMGKHRDFGDLIKLWETIAKDARTAQRANMTIRARNKRFPTVKTYAPELHLYQIKARLEKIREAESLYEDYLIEKAAKAEPPLIAEHPLELFQLADLISRIRKEKLYNHWKPHWRKEVFYLLKDIARICRSL